MVDVNNNLESVDLINDFKDKDYENAKLTTEMQEAGEELEQEKPLTEEQKQKCRNIYIENIANHEEVKGKVGFLEVDNGEIQFVDRTQKGILGIRTDLINTTFPDITKKLLGDDISLEKFVKYVNKEIFEIYEVNKMPVRLKKEFWNLKESGINIEYFEEYKDCDECLDYLKNKYPDFVSDNWGDIEEIIGKSSENINNGKIQEKQKNNIYNKQEQDGTRYYNPYRVLKDSCYKEPEIDEKKYKKHHKKGPRARDSQGRIIDL